MTNHAKGTALITGASSGIGASFARQFAVQGYDLILVARRQDRLQSLADELNQRFSIGAEPFVADLSDAAALEQVEKRIAEQDNLTMLVNNAGFGSFGSFIQVPIARHVEMIQVHVTATTRLCYAALPGMTQRKQGAIINVSSLAAFTPIGVYSATKAYLNTLSETLQAELKGTGIHVQALCPGWTRTEFHDSPEYKKAGSQKRSVPEFVWMTADDVVAASLQALGNGPVICIPGWKNRLAAAIARSALASLITGAARHQKLDS